MLKRQDYQEALAHRLNGQTYGEIRAILNIPKSTLSTWFSALKLSNKTKAILATKTKRGILALAEFNKTRTKKIAEENENTRRKFAEKIQKLSIREQMLIGAALYWAEGQKNFNTQRRSYPYISFTNSDPEMVKLFIKFMENGLGIARDKMWAIAMIYPSLNPIKSINYWRNITDIPKSRFRFYKALSRASAQKRPKNILPYGTLQIRIGDRLNFFKIRGLIDGIISNLNN